VFAARVARNGGEVLPPLRRKIPMNQPDPLDSIGVLDTATFNEVQLLLGGETHRLVHAAHGHCGLCLSAFRVERAHRHVKIL